MNPDTRLLHLPLSSRYAVSAALYLAKVPAGEYHMVGEISRMTELSPSYLSKILQRLANIGVLDSRRGAKGGYRLRRPATDITLSEIVATSRHLEKGPVPCMIEAKDCDAAEPCAMHQFVARAEGSLWRRLDAITLADLGAPNFELEQGEIK
ncbi:MAG: Rrf2 family transcriptional regulator [Elusimicrobia bacterium]|nr:Rrf2 family transcriptional regulator [Elusimicrobiota bacterium]